ncbi:type II toxin-antitoxin system VapC family toxin [Actinomyces sp. MRS3W]|uniref:type II toxin-antitoxin system VapC family toxin n=1 Tax=Actinomyces sp. MRS3W TaxID=2800796 RepID=UPI0028FD8105|nr:type II toxin-antitoxin system VapC family toxin [Actinomyces sp. MRS3W]MDU0347558.1 type II toxin-antitoxin system VapC family toxin [Actinomyces sp. MRS3W]
MIVVDASAMIEALVGRTANDELLDAFAQHTIAVPHLLDIEALSALRGMMLGGTIDSTVAHAAREDYAALGLIRYGAAPLADRIWHLRHQYTAYDANYIALAEGLDVPLLTCDHKLDAGGHTATVVVHSR